MIPSLNKHESTAILKCKDCNHKWIPSRQETLSTEIKRIKYRDNKYIKKWIESLIPDEILKTPNLKALDIGCWDGNLLESLPQSWSLYGIEPNPIAANYAKQRGIKVYQDVIELVELDSNFFDIVFIMNVLEHLPDPLAVINKICNSTKTNGSLFAVTGNANALGEKIFNRNWYYYNYFEHTNFFSRISLKFAVTLAGYEIVKISKIRHQSFTFLGTLKKIFQYIIRLNENGSNKLLLPINQADRLKMIISRSVHSRDHLLLYAKKRV